MTNRTQTEAVEPTNYQSPELAEAILDLMQGRESRFRIASFSTRDEPLLAFFSHDNSGTAKSHPGVNVDVDGKQTGNQIQPDAHDLLPRGQRASQSSMRRGVGNPGPSITTNSNRNEGESE